ncbi:uncharacterized protein V1510DRAFT_371738 [Dipodascopsis tothii]|uniref:uncharacterized protein n=1 Tax=Dipodascopsis tothii TaxID=44089 RepID=UPI0034CE8A9C
MELNRAILLAVLVTIMLLTPESASPGQRQAFRDFVAAQKLRRDVLVNTTWDSGPVGLEGVGTLVVPEPVASAAAALWASQTGDPAAFFRNVTGVVRGRWDRRDDLGVEPLELWHSPDYVEAARNETVLRADDGGNITALSGHITFDLAESAAGAVQMVEAAVAVADDVDDHTHTVAMRGVHFVDSGNMLLTTTSRKFAGLFALPHLALTEDRYDRAREPLLRELNDTIAALDRVLDHDVNPSLGAQPAAPVNACEYVAYVQLHRAPLEPADLAVVEAELRTPLGRPHAPVPAIELAAVVWSPNCGTVLEARHVQGPKIERFWAHAGTTAQIAGALALGQIWLLIRQMNDTNTPSTVSRLSFWTIGLMALVDGYFCMGYLTAAIFIESTFLPFMTVAFLSFLLVSVFGMRYLILIHRIQRPEWRATPAPTPAPAAAPAPAPTTGPAGLPLPATAPAPAPAPPPDDDGRSDVSLLYSRFYFILLGFIFMTLNASTWPAPLRKAFQHTLFLALNSYWVPQIYRNVMRGCRRAFKWEFVVGMSVIRLCPALYLYLFPENIIFYDVNPFWAAIIVGWVWLQIVALVSQDILGPRFFVPERLLPPSYDYHPALLFGDAEADDDLEAGPSVGNVKPAAEGSAVIVLGATDCAICMQPINVRADDADPSPTTAGLLARRHYMVTPCRHIFHTPCLEAWMRFKLQCPTCRNPLPPL